MKKTKNFNYGLYEFEQEAKIFILTLSAFILGFVLGYWCKNTEYEDKINKQNIEIVDLKEKIQRERFNIK